MNIYDFDGTLYEGDSTVDFYYYVLKRNPQIIRFIPKQLLGFILYALKRIDKTSLKEYFFSFVRGIDIDRAVELFWEDNQKKIYSWYLDQQKKDDLIISASPEFLLKPICDRLGIKHLIASKVDTTTGKFISPNCRGEEKVTRLYNEYGVVRVNRFYSDSESDLPLAMLANDAFFIKNGNIMNWIIP